MEPILTAIVAALTASGKDVVQKALKDSYNGLKELLRRKFGAQSDLVEAVEGLEKKPESSARRATVQEELQEAKADADSEIVAAAEALLDQLKELPGGEQHIMSARGSYIAQADRGSTATVNVVANNPLQGRPGYDSDPESDD